MPQIALVVDDSMLVRHTVCRYFEERGFAVESATNGADALEILNSLRPDIIVTDLKMPRMDGHQLIAALKAKPETARIPVVILAARQSSSPESEAEKQADFVIFKDIDITDQLQRALDTTLRRSAGKD